jgi:predicted phage baseplate assembly protein
MSDLAPNLDDLRFQKDLVDAARQRIIRYCPEWTDYNLSDPGITLIELFSWMTEMLVYRLNRVPERNYLKFLEMMGVTPFPVSSARAELTFYLSVPLPISPEDETTAVIPRGLEVSTRPGEGEEAVPFTVDQRMVFAPPRLVQLRRKGDMVSNYLPRLRSTPFHAFSKAEPVEGDCFYLGFDEAHDISGYLLRLNFECEETKAVGVTRSDPPWVWECSTGDGAWQEILLSQAKGERDTTGGLNNPSGSLVLNLPLNMRTGSIDGNNAYWVKCTYDNRREGQGCYDQSPIITSVYAQVIGGTCWATHASTAVGEVLGHSSGEPGQTFRLLNAPVLALAEDELVEVEEKRAGELVFVPWERVEDFSGSDHFDRHFTLDESTGTVRFGPGVIQQNGAVRQYGRVPEAGRRIRISSYRFGGGAAGNVPAGRIQMLRSSVPYVDRVINLKRAEGGLNQETLEEVKLRARREMRAQQRAVTAADFENLIKNTSQKVARVKCSGPGSKTSLAPGTIDILIVPSVKESLKAGDFSKLKLEDDLISRVRANLDKHRLLSTVIMISEPLYIGVKTCIEVVRDELIPIEVVRARVDRQLKRFLSPLPVFDVDGEPLEFFGARWEGWPFGRDLFVSELYSLVQQVSGVRHVLNVDVTWREMQPSKESIFAELEKRGEMIRDLSMSPVKERILRVPENALLCSLSNEVAEINL